MAARTEYRFHGVRMLTTSHPDIRRIKRTDAQPSIHGNKLWRSSFLLIDYLKKNPLDSCNRVMDAGCGWGTSGIWCARSLGAEVTAVDADPDVFPYLHANASANGVEIMTRASRFERISTRELEQYDLLVAADICFWDELVKPVYNLVNRAVKAGVRRIVIADPGRSPFVEVARLCEARYGADIIDWQTRRPLPASGSLMVLENS